MYKPFAQAFKKVSDHWKFVNRQRIIISLLTPKNAENNIMVTYLELSEKQTRFFA
jgi:hypothetical protein